MKLVASKLLVSTLVVSLSGCVAHVGQHNQSKLSKAATSSNQSHQVSDTQNGSEAAIVVETV